MPLVCYTFAMINEKQQQSPNRSAYMREYREANREKIRENQRRYYKKHAKLLYERKREWIKRNPDYHKKQRAKRLKRRLKELGVIFTQYLRANPCEDCGESDIRCLEFHHLNRKAKGNVNVSSLIDGGSSIERIQKEIDKCIVLCANCHCKRHGRNGVRMNAMRRERAAIWRIANVSD